MTEVRTFILRLLAVSILASSMAWAAPVTLPYRFLLVISDQWKDDASLVIQRPNDFQFLAALLKTWGLPFDILRLDQQRLDRYHLLDREGRPLYGTILWNAGAAKVPDQDLEVLEGLVAQGASVVMVADAVANPRVAALAGLRYAGEYKSTDALAFPLDHFIVRGVKGREAELMAGAGYTLGGSQVIAENAAVAARPRQASVPHRSRSSLRRPHRLAGGRALCRVSCGISLSGTYSNAAWYGRRATLCMPNTTGRYPSSWTTWAPPTRPYFPTGTTGR